MDDESVAIAAGENDRPDRGISVSHKFGTQITGPMSFAEMPENISFGCGYWRLIPLVLRAVMSGNPVTVFGDDYATPDGTCIRDYIHVEDLAEAHILALEYLLAGGSSDQFNVGTGSGHSVMEVIRAVEEVTGQKVPYVMGTRREGDPASLVASSDKLQAKLGWQPRSSDLKTIVKNAWNFARQHA